MNVQGLKVLAQVSLDAFYQDYRPADSFLRLEHFLYLCKAADGKLKQDEYDKQVNLNLRKGTPNAPIILSAGNYYTETVDVKEEAVSLTHRVLTFAGASPTISVLSVEVPKGCSDLMPIQPEEAWQVKNITNVVFWTVDCDGLKFFNLKNNCNPDKIKVKYIPELNDDSNVPENRKWAILNMVNAYIKSAQQGTIIDMNNDGNTNVATQLEINKYLLKASQK